MNASQALKPFDRYGQEIRCRECGGDCRFVKTDKPFERQLVVLRCTCCERTFTRPKSKMGGWS